MHNASGGPCKTEKVSEEVMEFRNRATANPSMKLGHLAWMPEQVRQPAEPVACGWEGCRRSPVCKALISARLTGGACWMTLRITHGR